MAIKTFIRLRFQNLSAYYLILIACCILIFWILFAATNTDFKNEQAIEMYFHISSEIIMSILCLIAGWYQIVGKSKIPAIAAHAMLIYSTLNAAGFYAESKQDLMFFLFIFLFLVSFSILTFLLLKSVQASSRIATNEG